MWKERGSRRGESQAGLHCGSGDEHGPRKKKRTGERSQSAGRGSNETD